MPSPRTPAQRGRNYTVNIRMSRDEIEAARKLGSGNVSMGFRQAAQWGADQELEACCEWLCTERIDVNPPDSAPPAARNRRA
jgi:hypothetical protein